MPLTKRRSARLAATDGITSPSFTPNLESLMERESTPQKEASLDAIVSSGRGKMPGSFEEEVLKTPKTAGRLRPEKAEMHPRQAHQSTTKGPDSGLRLGFANINEKEDAPTRALESTPSKSNLPSSSGFNFKWTREETDLSAEAQRIMESVRVEAAKIKEKMQLERQQQALKDAEANGNTGGRRFAKPKSRFSDVHKAEFSKMDSIANHVSLWKSKPQVSPPKDLKRTSSRANMDNTPKQGLKRTKSRADLDEATPGKQMSNDTPKPSGKRIKYQAASDVSQARSRAARVTKQPQTPHKFEYGGEAVTPGTPTPSTITTPTKASLARAASVKSMRPSKLPSLMRSKSAKAIASPAPPKTEGNNKYFSALARAPSMKSILHRVQPKFSNDLAKIAAGTHVPAEKNLKDLQAAGSLADMGSPTPKRVGFKIDGIDSATTSAASSPSKIPSRFSNTLNSPSKLKDAVSYPSLVSYPAIEKHIPNPLGSNPHQPSDFTFRSSKEMKFGPGAPGLKSNTIRPVRPSGIVTPATAFGDLPGVPHGFPNKKRRRIGEDDSDLENVPPPSNRKDSPAKKRKMLSSPGPSRPLAVSPDKKRFGSKTPNTKGKRTGLSLARLNMLARPKNRG